MNIKELIEQAHENAVDKGFYDCPECEGVGERYTDENGDIVRPINAQYKSECLTCNETGKNPNKNIGELLMLVVSELGEALEAHRKNRFTKVKWLEGYEKDLKTSDFPLVFERSIKDTFEDEIADVFIRLFDLCGYLGIDIEKYIKAKMAYNKTRPKKHGKEY